MSNTFLFSNKAKTVLAAALLPASLTITLAPGSGALFPAPTGDEIFSITIGNGTTQPVEIIYVISISGDIITSFLRGQEGTPVGSWSSGDIVQCLFTSGTADNFIQVPELSTLDSSISSLSTSTSTGLSSTNSLISSLSSSTSTGLSSANSSITSLSTGVSAGDSSLSTGVSTNNSSITSLSTGLNGLQAASGYQKFPNGLIMQWTTGTNQAAAGNQIVSFPIAFPSSVSFVSVTSLYNSASQFGGYASISNSLTQATVARNGADNGFGVTPKIFAIGK